MPKIRSLYSMLLKVQELGVLIALFVLCAWLTMRSDRFLTPLNLMGVARQASYYGIMAVGMVYVLALGEVDLSVGSIFTLTNIVMAMLLRDKAPLVVALGAALLTGTLAGALNGFLSVALRIPMIIVTLGTLSVFHGLALVLCQSQPISNFPKENFFFEVGGGKVLGMPFSVIVMITVCALAWIAFYATIHGRRVQAIGGNQQAARLSGLPIAKYRIAVMAVNGTIAALAGTVALAYSGSSDPTSGQGFELWVIASAIIGGTALSGGAGSVPGAVLGAIIIAVIRNGLVLLGYSTYAGIMVTGGVIILAVAIDSLVKRRTAIRAQ